MPGNTFGKLFRFTSFGESHGPATGGIIDGCPAGLTMDFNFIREELVRRSMEYPGSTSRKEPDEVEWLSGLAGAVTLGTPIAFLVRNRSQQSDDYNELADFYRPSHADYTYDAKYGIRDQRGGGRASGRETVSRVVAGSIAKIFLKTFNIFIEGTITRIGPLNLSESYEDLDFDKIRTNAFKLANPSKEEEILALLRQSGKEDDTLGGSIACRIIGVPPGLGEPVFDKLQADLAKSLMSIGTAKAFEYGIGFRAAAMPGSVYNDRMKIEDGNVAFVTNHDGGIQGGISNGEDIYFQVGFKPVPSIHQPQQMVNADGEAKEITLTGRHDTCHIPRLVVIVEAMAALVIADHILLHRSSRMT